MKVFNIINLNFNDDIDEAGGIGMTTEQANQLQTIYDKMNKNKVEIYFISLDSSWITSHSLTINSGFDFVYIQVDSISVASGASPYAIINTYDKNTGSIKITLKDNAYFQNIKATIIGIYL